MTDAHSLVLEAVTKVFETPEGRLITAVDRVSLAINQGEFVTLLGPSGCGKTTTLRLIAGFEFPTAGRILLDGKDIAHVPPNKRGMAMVFQSYALFPHMSVFENIAYGLRLRKQPRAEIEQTVREMMALVNLSGLEHRWPASLSGGQQQRVALARAMAVRPKVLLFDEPLSNLDAKLRVSLRAEIRRLQKQLGITSIYVTHDQAEAMSLSDRVVVMNAGRVEQVSTPAELYARPATRFVADFIGRANFLNVTVMRAAHGWAEIMLWGQPMRVPAHASVGPGPAALMLRPEAICLCRDGVARFQGRVRAVSYLGSAVEYEIETNGQVLSVSDADAIWSGAFAEGALVGWDFAPERGYVIP
jgi:iron(III) transport system ATP-binding protein